MGPSERFVRRREVGGRMFSPVAIICRRAGASEEVVVSLASNVSIASRRGSLERNFVESEERDGLHSEGGSEDGFDVIPSLSEQVRVEDAAERFKINL